MSAQLALDLPPRSRGEFVLERARGQPYHFRPGFIEWLADNLHIWTRFEDQANAVYERGRRHYSARTIIHYLRHETMLREVSDADWKINNDISPDLARLYLILYPERGTFFELRESQQRREAA